ncbi:MAG: hypothetical protein MHM6MM_007903 [Cercozoa sp. M6MM]
MVREPQKSHVSFCADAYEPSGILTPETDADDLDDRDVRLGYSSVRRDSELVELHDLAPQRSLGVAVVKDSESSKRRVTVEKVGRTD